MDDLPPTRTSYEPAPSSSASTPAAHLHHHHRSLFTPQALGGGLGGTPSGLAGGGTPYADVSPFGYPPAGSSSAWGSRPSLGRPGSPFRPDPQQEELSSSPRYVDAHGRPTPRPAGSTATPGASPPTQLLSPNLRAPRSPQSTLLGAPLLQPQVRWGQQPWQDADPFQSYQSPFNQPQQYQQYYQPHQRQSQQQQQQLEQNYIPSILASVVKESGGGGSSLPGSPSRGFGHLHFRRSSRSRSPPPRQGFLLDLVGPSSGAAASGADEYGLDHHGSPSSPRHSALAHSRRHSSQGASLTSASAALADDAPPTGSLYDPLPPRTGSSTSSATGNTPRINSSSLLTLKLGATSSDGLSSTQTAAFSKADRPVWERSSSGAKATRRRRTSSKELVLGDQTIGNESGRQSPLGARTDAFEWSATNRDDSAVVEGRGVAVRVVGFPAAAGQREFERFSRLGGMVGGSPPRDGANWMVLTYVDRAAAERALALDQTAASATDGAVGATDPRVVLSVTEAAPPPSRRPSLKQRTPRRAAPAVEDDAGGSVRGEYGESRKRTTELDDVSGMISGGRYGRAAAASPIPDLAAPAFKRRAAADEPASGKRGAGRATAGRTGGAGEAGAVAGAVAGDAGDDGDGGSAATVRPAGLWTRVLNGVFGW